MGGSLGQALVLLPWALGGFCPPGPGEGRHNPPNTLQGVRNLELHQGLRKKNLKEDLESSQTKDSPPQGLTRSWEENLKEDLEPSLTPLGPSAAGYPRKGPQSLGPLEDQ